LKVEKVDLVDDEAKQRLFKRLLGECSASSQVHKIYELVDNWEDFEENSSEQFETNCLANILLRLAELDSRNCDWLDLLPDADSWKLSPDVCSSLLEIWRSSEVLNSHSTLFILKLKLTEEYPLVISSLLTQSSIESPLLARLIIESGLVASLVKSHLYADIVSIATNEEIEDGREAESLTDMIIRQLREAGFKPQAATLEMTRDGVPAGLRTMLSVVQRFLK